MKIESSPNKSKPPAMRRGKKKQQAPQSSDDIPATRVKVNQREHYVNNKEFSGSIVEYVTSVTAAIRTGKEVPIPTEYIGTCLLKISEGLSRKPNFIRYTYREEMVMDGVENCLKAINNYNIEVATRTGLPNAFAYFTQICYFAFLRRISREKKQQDIKQLYIIHANIDSFANFSEEEGSGGHGVLGHTGGDNIIERIRNKVEQIHTQDNNIKAFGKSLKKKPAKIIDAPLEQPVTVSTIKTRKKRMANPAKVTTSNVEMLFGK